MKPITGADRKVPRELSRFQHSAVLGLAYRLTGEEEYAAEFAAQVEDWIEANPSGFGVNWQVSMDVAIRACNWLLGYHYCRGSGSLSPDWRREFFLSLYRHGRHIRSNLERYPLLTANHYLADLAGLVYLGYLLPPCRETEKWREFGIAGLKSEIGKQVYPDGCDFEASTCYQRQALEYFFFSTLVAAVNEDYSSGADFRQAAENIFGSRYLERLYWMFDAVLHLIKPNGRMPQVGDNDSGRLFGLFPRHNLDMRYLLALGAVFFAEGRWKIREFFPASEDLAEATLVYGRAGERIWNNLPWHSLADVDSKILADAGWCVIRSGRDYCLVSSGPNGQNGIGGHAHNDKLSFELCLDGRDLIVDPGTFTYTGDPVQRALFRSTGFHNTVVIDGREQNLIRPDNPWSLRPGGRSRILRRATAPGYDYLQAEYRYFPERPFGRRLIHRREVYFSRESRFWVIRDVLRGRGRHHYSSRLHLVPGLDIIRESEKSVAFGNRRRLRLILVRDEETGWRIGESFISRGYGLREPAPVVFHEGHFSGSIVFGMLLVPTRAGPEIQAEAENAYRFLENNRESI